MESAQGGAGEKIVQPDGQRACMACRGTGQVVSHLGGESKSVTCPWCQGTGFRGAVPDAQKPWLSGAEDGAGGT